MAESQTLWQAVMGDIFRLGLETSLPSSNAAGGGLLPQHFMCEVQMREKPECAISPRDSATRRDRGCFPAKSLSALGNCYLITYAHFSSLKYLLSAYNFLPQQKQKLIFLCPSSYRVNRAKQRLGWGRLWVTSLLGHLFCISYFDVSSWLPLVTSGLYIWSPAWGFVLFCKLSGLCPQGNPQALRNNVSTSFK